MKTFKIIFEILWYCKEYIRVRFFQKRTEQIDAPTYKFLGIGTKPPKPDTTHIGAYHIIYVANMLNIPNEYEVFQEAWIDSMEFRLEEKAMEKYFVDYICRDQIPEWVEDYVRKTIEKDNPCKVEEKQ